MSDENFTVYISHETAPSGFGIRRLGEHHIAASSSCCGAYMDEDFLEEDSSYRLFRCKICSQSFNITMQEFTDFISIDSSEERLADFIEFWTLYKGIEVTVKR